MFINAHMTRYCEQENIMFTGSRVYGNNDNYFLWFGERCE